MKIACGILSAVALVLPAAPASAHDPSCLVVYENITGTSPAAPFLSPGWELADDVHTNIAGSVVLCAVDVRGRSTAAGTLAVRVYANGGDALAPGVLLAGPLNLVFNAASGATATYHFEVPLVTAGQHLWVSSRWEGASGGWVAAPRTTATVGVSHDTWHFKSPGGDFHDDNGTSQADMHVVVYGTAPVPARVATWGTVKAVYR